MVEFYEDSHIKVYNKSCTDMGELAGNSIQCCVTSPPYWGLRRYDGNQDIPEWGCSFGLEPTPELYVAHSVEILREVRRVLRKDGVVFWNIGDSYYASGGAGGDYNKGGLKEGQPKYKQGKGKSAYNLKPKDLCLIPFRVAIAAQEDGWWIRSVIIWNKPNPMPESVKDRPTDAYEHILMLTKSSKYYWDIEAVREIADYDGRKDTIMKPSSKYSDRNFMNDGANPNSVHTRGAERWPHEIDGTPARNLRNVWTFPTHGYPEAHFATFPEKLPETCIKAGSKEGDLILDPFAGSGTTLWVAKKLNRKAIGYELSEKYCQLIVERNRQQVMGVV